jgi:uncharacterized protein
MCYSVASNNGRRTPTDMPKIESPSPTLSLSRTEARRYLLTHQRLWPPRALSGKADVLDFIHHIGCIQYDPVNLVGQNPELVLQARVAGYTPALLAELLYADRTLIDGWDKQAAIHRIEDWPYFARHRAWALREHGDPVNPPMAIAAAVTDAIRERGPLCSADLGHDDTIDWWWGVPTRLGRAALEILFCMGEVGVHHRVNTRRYFDLIERLIPVNLLAAADPNPTEETYEDWHVARRVGSLGLANPAAGEYWSGMGGMKAEARRTILARLSAQGVLIPVAVEGIAQAPLFIRSSDVSLLHLVASENDVPPTATFIAPLDNLIWDRDLIRRLFDFDYTWEVYKPAAQRKFGHYVLPVLYGDRFIARVEPIFDRKTRVLTIVNWWWEADVQADAVMRAALADCLTAFGRFLGAGEMRLGKAAAEDRVMSQVLAFV